MVFLIQQMRHTKYMIFFETIYHLPCFRHPATVFPIPFALSGPQSFFLIPHTAHPFFALSSVPCALRGPQALFPIPHTAHLFFALRPAPCALSWPQAHFPHTAYLKPLTPNIIRIFVQKLYKMKKLWIVIVALLSVAGLKAQEGDFKPALLIVDIQYFYFPGEGPGLDGAAEAALVAQEVLATFRGKQLPVVHVKHAAARGADIHIDVAPIEGEKVITKQEVNSFVGTDLLEHLRQEGVNRLLIMGMQTHMCLEAAVRAASDYGFDCIVVSDGCATRDLQFSGVTIKASDVHASTFATLVSGRYARVVTLDEFLKTPDNLLFR
jgi:nicotinamidase-related amidase